jgi:hypothetical protein
MNYVQLRFIDRAQMNRLCLQAESLEDVLLMHF